MITSRYLVGYRIVKVLSLLLVDKISNPTNAVVSPDSDGASDYIFDRDVDEHNLTTPHQPSNFSMGLSTNNMKRGNQHFSPCFSYWNLIELEKLLPFNNVNEDARKISKHNVKHNMICGVG